jgi:hypothetical protein
MYNAILYPLAKGLSAHKAMSEEIDWPGAPALRTYFLLAVVTSPMFYLDSSVEPYQLAEMDHICLHRRFNSRTIKGSFTFDFVNSEALERFLRAKVVPFHEYVDGAIQNGAVRLQDG